MLRQLTGLTMQQQKEIKASYVNCNGLVYIGKTRLIDNTILH